MANLEVKAHFHVMQNPLRDVIIDKKLGHHRGQSNSRRWSGNVDVMKRGRPIIFRGMQELRITINKIGRKDLP
jgi:hypothetical protein